MSRPDFIIIGAMKCATSTLHDQLARQPGIFMSDPKEPNFFSDDAVYARGPAWYASLFASDAAVAAQLRGESSTHYTKRPTHPHTVERMVRALPDVRLVYLMKHPLERLVSHYIHGWTMREIDGPLGAAVARHPEMLAYSRYGMQLQPFIEAYGPDRVLPVFVPYLARHPQAALEAITRFLGYAGQPVWQESLRSNVSEERLRLSAGMTRFLFHPAVSAVRRAIVPQRLRTLVKNRLKMRRRPDVAADDIERLAPLLEEDLGWLSERFGTRIDLENFDAVTAGIAPGWRAA